MQIDALTTVFLARELDKALFGFQVVKSGDLRSGSAFFLFTRAGDRRILVFHGNPSMQLLYISPVSGMRFKSSGAFSERFTRAAKGAVVTRVAASDGDRVISIALDGVFRDTKSRRRMSLTFFMTGAGANILLEDQGSGKRICSVRPPRTMPEIMAFLLPWERGLPSIFSPERLDKEKTAECLQTGNRHELAKVLRTAVYGGSYPLAYEISCHTYEMVGMDFHERPAEKTGADIGHLIGCAAEKVRKKLENTELPEEPMAVQCKRFPGGGMFFPFTLSSLSDSVDTSILKDSTISAVQARAHAQAPKEPNNDDSGSKAAFTLTSLRKLRKKLKKRLAKQEKDLEEAGGIDELREMGELLLANAHLDLKGESFIELERQGRCGGMLRIPLDSSLNMAKNAQRYFTKARKLADSVDIVTRRKSETEEAIAKAGILIERLQQNDASEFIEAAEALLEQESSFQQTGTSRRTTDSSRSVYKRFELQTGWELLIGKTASDNDRLTFKIAKPRDFWLHAQGASGSHGIIPLAGKKSPPPAEVIRKAAEITAFFSSAKHSALVPVVYTERRYVRKIRNAPPGTVSFSRVKTLFVAPVNPALKMNRDSH